MSKIDKEIEASADRIAKQLLDAVDRARPLCPDHQDKQHGKTCLACRIEQLEKALRFYANHENWKGVCLDPEYVSVSRTGRDRSGIDYGWEVAEHALKGASR